MSYHHPTQEVLSDILSSSKRIAVVGLSDKPNRTSYQVASYMQQAGYEIIPVNPNIEQALGVKAYRSLEEIEGEIDIVNIFRRSSDTFEIAEEAVKVGAKAVWLQLGISNDQAYQVAHDAGLYVVMNSCIKVNHAQLFEKKE